jgi:GSH-dependent disulfide-bond oxidoreductase
MLELHGMSSPNVRKVVLLLEELGEPYRFTYVDVFAGAQFEADFAALSPFAKVPVLVDSAAGCTIFESGAILIYLAERAGRFLPAAGCERAEVMSWLMAQMGSIGPMFGQVNHFRTALRDAESYAALRYQDIAARLYGVLERRLAEREWVAGGGYSIADMATYPWALYIDQHGFSWDDFPNLRRWRDAIALRPAARRTQELFDSVQPKDRASLKARTPEDMDRFFWRDRSAKVAKPGRPSN